MGFQTLLVLLSPTPEGTNIFSCEQFLFLLCRAVAVGVPVPSEGIVDIPVIEREVTGAQPHFKVTVTDCSYI